MLDDCIHSSAPMCPNTIYADHECSTVGPSIYADIIMRFMIEVDDAIRALDEMECPQPLLELTFLIVSSSQLTLGFRLSPLTMLSDNLTESWFK